MPELPTALTMDAAVERIRNCFRPDAGTRVGIEAEFIVLDDTDPTRIVTAAESRAAAGDDPLPAGSPVSVEPGGQLELSAAPHDDLRTALDELDTDESALAARCAAAGLRLVPIGLDPFRASPRSVDSPRFVALQRRFDAVGPRPMAMATGSAGVQVSLDVGPDPLRSWRLANRIGPLFLAMFANSPVHLGRPTGWKSTRQLFWMTVPGRRGAPVPTWHVDEWVRHVLDTEVLLVRSGALAEEAPDGLTFGAWVVDGHRGRRPTIADLDYHLTTIYPPVRPRGYLELRMVDAVPSPARRVFVTLAATALHDAGAGAALAAACRPVAGRWADAARHGLADRRFRDAAVTALTVVAETVEADLAEECLRWRDEMAADGRCPADEVVIG